MHNARALCAFALVAHKLASTAAGQGFTIASSLEGCLGRAASQANPLSTLSRHTRSGRVPAVKLVGLPAIPASRQARSGNGLHCSLMWGWLPCRLDLSDNDVQKAPCGLTCLVPAAHPWFPGRTPSGQTHGHRLCQGGLCCVAAQPTQCSNFSFLFLVFLGPAVHFWSLPGPSTRQRD